MIEDLIKQKKKEFEKIFGEDPYFIWRFIETALKETAKMVAQEAIDLSDKCETNNTKFDEWRAFKHFRNTLRDKYANKTTNK